MANHDFNDIFSVFSSFHMIFYKLLSLSVIFQHVFFLFILWPFPPPAPKGPGRGGFGGR